MTPIPCPSSDKFLSVKAVIFFSFWQGVVFSLLVATGIVQEVGYYTADYLSYGMQVTGLRVRNPFFDS